MKISLKKLWVFAVSITLLAAGSSLAVAKDGGEGEKDGADIKTVMAEKLANIPGKSMTAIIVNYAPGARSSEHQHAGSVFAYVLSGAIRSENSVTGPVRVYKAGESFFEPAGTKHLVSENASTTEPASMLVVFVADDGAQLTTFDNANAAASDDNDLAHQIINTMLQVPGNQAGYRTVHAKGIVCEGMFTPSKNAAALSKAAHFQGAPVPITVRFSDGSPEPIIPDNSPNAGPRGIAIRFKLPGGVDTDIVAMSHNGFVVGTGEEFLALQKAIVATDPSKPHPWPVEEFLGSHPRAVKFVTESQVIPASFANEAYFANHAFVFVNKKGVKQAGRYKLIPVAGQRDLSAAEAQAKSANFLLEDLKARLATAPIKYRLVVQLPNAGDPTNDSSLVWPDDRKTIEVGTISITSVVADNAAAERTLAYDPTRLVDGIELSDDPIPALRSRVYALAVKIRRQQSGQTSHP
jgi:catalase